jgi:RND superfamily putative drug exporter
MVEAAARLKDEVTALAAPGIEADLTGAPGMWSGFNQANKEAMLKSELLSWPVTMAILVLAFGSLVAAGLPLIARPGCSTWGRSWRRSRSGP